MKTTPANSPLTRLGPRSQKPNTQPARLSLRRIIGTTTTSSSGLACHYSSGSFAYCAGSAAVLAKLDENGEISYRFFRAHPTASPMNPSTSFYNPCSPSSISESRRRTILSFRNSPDERSANGSPRRIWGDEGSSKTLSARERVKAVSCVDLSPNGRFLAIGETGYSPRVNIFSTVAGAPTDVPLSILTEHSFGVRCVAFSPNSRWLATLGDVNDGFLFIWSINSKTGAARLHFTNKCTASVLDMAWCGNSLITVGTRYVKVWRVGEHSCGIHTKQGRSLLEDASASPVPRTLLGRNSLLGDLADSTFTCVAPISECEAVLCTKTGAMCLLDDRTGSQELKYIRQLAFPSQSIAVDPESQRIWFAKGNKQLGSESFEGLRSAEGSRPASSFSSNEEEAVVTPSASSPAVSEPFSAFGSPYRSSPRRRKRRKGIVTSICLPSKIVSIEVDRNIRIQDLCRGVDAEDTSGSSSTTLSAHNDAVQGVVPLPEKSGLGDYVTWSLEGAVNFWSVNGSLTRSEIVELEQPDQFSKDYIDYDNELRLVRVSEDGRFIVSGDRLGVLQVFGCRSRESTKVRAHSAEITDISLKGSGESPLVATSSRDRTVQLLQYKSGEIELLQTFDDHVGAVTAVSFEGDFLASASSDRTVILRKELLRTKDDGTTMLAYVAKRVITLKASPTSITFPEPDTLVVSTMDRQILTYSVSRGVAIDGFKAFDGEGEDAVVLSSLSINSISDNFGSRRILAGFSSTDKSIRLYDFDRGVLLAREMGHTEGISSIAVINHADQPIERDNMTLISTGLDGLVMVWNAATAPFRHPSTPLQELSQGQATIAHTLEGTPIRDSVLRQPPLRKVLSKLDLADMATAVPSTLLNGDQSSPRLKKKTSRYSMAPCKMNGLPTAHSQLDMASGQGGPVADRGGDGSASAPLPADVVNSQISLRQASAPLTDVSRGQGVGMIDRLSVRQCQREGSPSPPPAPPSLPSTPKAINRANKGRLRRPPSVPSDLRNQSVVQNRRKSMGNANEFGSIGMASEQVCRTLRAYRKKIKAASTTEQLQLDEVEVELLATLRAVEERRDSNMNRRNKAATENDLDNLATLMETSGFG
jgi:WD40 repeat protein